ALVRELDVEKVAEVVVEQTRTALQSELSILWLTDEQERALHVVAQHGLAARAAGALAVLPLGSNRPVTVAARNREVMEFSSEQAATFPEAAAFGHSIGLRRSLIVPLAFRDKLVGVLTIGRTSDAH